MVDILDFMDDTMDNVFDLGIAVPVAFKDNDIIIMQKKGKYMPENLHFR